MEKRYRNKIIIIIITLIMFINKELKQPQPGDVFFVGWLVGCLMSQQHAGVSQKRIC